MLFLFMLPMDPAGAAVIAKPVPAVQIIDAAVVEAQPISNTVTLTVNRNAPPVVSVRTETLTTPVDGVGNTVTSDVTVVEFDTGDGVATTDQATYDKLVATAALGETDEEYYARLNAQVCDAKPWMCGE